MKTKKISRIIVLMFLFFSLLLNAQEPFERKVFHVVDKVPEFPGGMDELFSFISRNVEYPGEASTDSITGKVVVNFVVKTTGKIRNAQIRESAHPLLDKEAIRVIEKMPEWKPGKIKGKPVNVAVSLPIHFKLH